VSVGIPEVFSFDVLAMPAHDKLLYAPWFVVLGRFSDVLSGQGTFDISCEMRLPLLCYD
jgi:hypothetical protein